MGGTKRDVKRKGYPMSEITDIRLTVYQMGGTDYCKVHKSDQNSDWKLENCIHHLTAGDWAGTPTVMNFKCTLLLCILKLILV